MATAINVLEVGIHVPQFGLVQGTVGDHDSATLVYSVEYERLFRQPCHVNPAALDRSTHLENCKGDSETGQAHGDVERDQVARSVVGDKDETDTALSASGEDQKGQVCKVSKTYAAPAQFPINWFIPTAVVRL